MREEEEVVLLTNSNKHNEHPEQGSSSSSNNFANYVMDIYPLSRYYFGSKDTLSSKDETLSESRLRFKSKYYSYFLSPSCLNSIELLLLIIS